MTGSPPPAEILRDLDAVLAFTDNLIDQSTGPIPALGTAAWKAAGRDVQLASIAVWTAATINELDPAVIAGRLAAEVAELRRQYLRDMRQASHAIAAGADWRAQAERPSFAELQRRRAG